MTMTSYSTGYFDPEQNPELLQKVFLHSLLDQTVTFVVMLLTCKFFVYNNSDSLDYTASIFAKSLRALA